MLSGKTWGPVEGAFILGVLGELLPEVPLVGKDTEIAVRGSRKFRTEWHQPIHFLFPNFGPLVWKAGQNSASWLRSKLVA